MTEKSNSKLFDLEERTFRFAKNVALACRMISKISSNYEYTRQVIRSSASIGANYIEANKSFN